MTSSNLENLARIGQLKSEPPAQDEFDGLVASGRKRLHDDQCRLLSLCHERRNDIEYSGTANLDESLLSGLITVAGFVLESVEKLGCVGSPAPPPL